MISLEVWEGISRQLKACVPAKVLEYDDSNNTAKLKIAVSQPAFTDNGREIEYTEFTELENVPVADVSGVRYVPVPGQTHGHVIFNDFDIQEYIETRELGDLQSSRFHDLADGVFYPSESAKTGRPDPFITIVEDQVIINAPAGIYLNSGLESMVAPVCINGQIYSQHTHAGVFPGTSITATPTAPPCVPAIG